MIRLRSYNVKSNFYPRSPCGERPEQSAPPKERISISIHALLAESDARITTTTICIVLFLSTLSLRRATISKARSERINRFLSTLSLRRATSIIDIINNVVDNFYPRSPCGERRGHDLRGRVSQGFLSTLSLRRATTHYDNYNLHCTISIHALLAESDFTSVVSSTGTIDFYPRSPCGERPQRTYQQGEK